MKISCSLLTPLRQIVVNKAQKPAALVAHVDVLSTTVWPDSYHLNDSCNVSSAFDEFMSGGRSVSVRSVLCYSSTKSAPVIRGRNSNQSPKQFKFNAQQDGQAAYLFEFNDLNHVNYFINKVCPNFQSRVFPVTSRLVRHTAYAGYRDVHLLPKFSFDFETVNQEALENSLRKASSLENQIVLLYQLTRITSEGLRLRFLLASLVEDVLRAIFPKVVCLPFGSTVNGFAQRGCDLDVNIQLNQNAMHAERRSTANQFFFCAKYRPYNDRSYVQGSLRAIGAVLDAFVPGIVGMTNILNARVPIIKLDHSAFGISCDLTLDNDSAYKTAKALWTLCRLQPCLRPLLFTVRRWAREVGLTRQSPGTWLSNFQIICLVVAFLQCRRPSLLPPLNALADKRFQADQWLSADSPNLHSLLEEFFQFFLANFDGERQAFELNRAEVVPKSDFAALVIWNPFEEGHNIAKNLTLDEWQSCLRRMECALTILRDDRVCQGVEQNWGLLRLFDVNCYPKEANCNDDASNSTENVADQILPISAMNAEADDTIDKNNPNDRSIRTFSIEGEDHTLGVVLKYIISHYADVRVFTYSLVPMEDRIIVHIETKGCDAVEVLRRALNEAKHMFNTVENKFKGANEMYKRSKD